MSTYVYKIAIYCEIKTLLNKLCGFELNCFLVFCFFTLKINCDGSETRNIFIMDPTAKENIQLFNKNSVQSVGKPSFKTEYPSSEEKQPCCGELKVTIK